MDVQIEVSEHSGCDVTRPSGELDASTVTEFREHLASLVGTGSLVIDLCDVPFMDSAGLGALIGGIRRIRDAGGSVGVVCDRPSVLRLLHTTGFDRIVDVAPTLGEAVGNLAST
ncbi:MAG: STAS domain-containing protein [Microthrixaceae bacterium]|nr:STAS domain-containing protein [Microthrixaceae bacterium]